MFSGSIIDNSRSIIDASRSIIDASRIIIDDSRSIINDSRSTNVIRMTIVSDNLECHLLVTLKASFTIIICL